MGSPARPHRINTASRIATLDAAPSSSVGRLLEPGTVPRDAGRATPDGPDLITLGKRLRHRRRSRGLTLDTVARDAGISPSALSLIETGRREARLSTLQGICRALQSSLDDMLRGDAPSRRAALEIELERFQRSPGFTDLGVAPVRPGPRLPADVLESLVALHRRLAEVEAERDATPEHARRANQELRSRMRASDNWFADLEDAADAVLLAIGHDGGPLTRYGVEAVAEHLGFTLISTTDLPRSTRTVTDLRHRRIFLPATDAPSQRVLALAALGHQVLGHRPPRDYAEFLAQRVEVNYFAGAALVPQRWAVGLLDQARQRRDIAIEDLRDHYAVSYEMAAHRFTNLATEHLGIPVHFVRVNRAGVIHKCYANDGLVFPTDASGAVEGQLACRHWTSRQSFEQADWSLPHQQYTDTPAGTFWCTAMAERGARDSYAVSVGTPYEHTRWFRGRDTPHRSVSTCPDPGCCRRPPTELARSWEGQVWPSARVHSHLLAALPAGAFPGVDDREVLEFLTAHPAE